MFANRCRQSSPASGLSKISRRAVDIPMANCPSWHTIPSCSVAPERAQRIERFASDVKQTGKRNTKQRAAFGKEYRSLQSFELADSPTEVRRH